MPLFIILGYELDYAKDCLVILMYIVLCEQDLIWWGILLPTENVFCIKMNEWYQSGLIKFLCLIM